jgi:hypothetical protein
MVIAEEAWENAKADIPRHDAAYSGALYEPDGNEWRYDPVEKLWVCQCTHCLFEPHLVEKLTYPDLIAERTVSDWRPRTPGRHSDTRHLDGPAENVVDLLARLRPYPTEDLDEREAA